MKFLRPSYPLWNIHSEPFHLVLEHIFVVAQRALEEVARRLGQGLDAVPVVPPVAAWRPEVRVAQELSAALTLFHVLLGYVLETDAARR